MITKLMEIKIPTGLDPSTIALFIQTASQYESSVYVEVENKKVNAKSIMGMMTLGLSAGEKITVSAAGNDEIQAIEHIERYLNNESKAQ
ncbi:MAG: HPr family phosphocarrier protein [Eubacteriales bacterium]|nr:HPr family phosphocarrier protein [Eubacteriales bacterium]